MYKYFINHSYKFYSHDGHSHCFGTHTKSQSIEITREHAVSIIQEIGVKMCEEYAKEQPTFGFSDNGVWTWCLEPSDGFMLGDTLTVEYYPPKFEYIATGEDGDEYRSSRDGFVKDIGEYATTSLEESCRNGANHRYVIHFESGVCDGHKGSEPIEYTVREKK